MSIVVTLPAGTSFDPANPGPIGGTTPNTIAATEISVLKTALGTTSTMGLALSNTTAAAAGAQQVSPSLVLEGRGWKTNSTAASQTVRFRINVLPVQGTANPSATWRLQSEINASGTWTDQLTLTSAGTLTPGAGGSWSSSGIAPAGGSSPFLYTGSGLGAGRTAGVLIPVNAALQFFDGSTLSGALRMALSATGAGVLQLGVDHATTPTAQRIQAHGVTTGTGASLTLGGGSGDVAKGNVILDGGNRAAYDAAPDAATIRDILISHGLMAAA
jgi:hypothetical protein